MQRTLLPKDRMRDNKLQLYRWHLDYWEVTGRSTGKNSLIASAFSFYMQEDFEEMITLKKDSSSPDQYYLCIPLLARRQEKD